jgi:hypothetical protein
MAGMQFNRQLNVKAGSNIDINKQEIKNLQTQVVQLRQELKKTNKNLDPTGRRQAQLKLDELIDRRAELRSMIAQGRARAHVGSDARNMMRRIGGFARDIRDFSRGDISRRDIDEYLGYAVGFGGVRLENWINKYEKSIQSTQTKMRRMFEGGLDRSEVPSGFETPPWVLAGGGKTRYGFGGNIFPQPFYSAYGMSFRKGDYLKKRFGWTDPVYRLDPSRAGFFAGGAPLDKRFALSGTYLKGSLHSFASAEYGSSIKRLYGAAASAWEPGKALAAESALVGLQGLRFVAPTALIGTMVAAALSSKINATTQRISASGKKRGENSMKLMSMYASARNPFVRQMIERASGENSIHTQSNMVYNLERINSGQRTYTPSEREIQNQINQGRTSYNMGTGWGAYQYGLPFLGPIGAGAGAYMAHQGGGGKNWAQQAFFDMVPRTPFAWAQRLGEDISDWWRGTDRRKLAIDELIRKKIATRKAERENRKDRMEEFLSDPVEANNEKLRNLKFEAIKNERNRRSMMAPTV